MKKSIAYLVSLSLAATGIAQAAVMVNNSVPVPAATPIKTTPIPTLPQTRQVMNAPASMQAAPKNLAAKLPPLPPESSLYHSAAKSLLPLSPKDLLQFRKRLDATQQASEVPIAPPQARTVVLTVHPNRGSIPVIPMTAGYVTDLSFVNEWGQPWRVSDATVGNGAAFQVVNPTVPGSIATETALEDKESKSAKSAAAIPTSTVIVAAKQKYRDSNLSVLLHGLPTPLLFSLQTGGHQVDYRLIIRVAAVPDGALPPIGGLGRSHDAADALLMRALYDTMPQAAKSIPFGYGDAWKLNGKLWLRTRQTLLSPAWLATLQSPDGVHAYELPATDTVMLSIQGEPHTLSLWQGA